MTTRQARSATILVVLMFLSSAVHGQRSEPAQADNDPLDARDRQRLDVDAKAEASEAELARLEAGLPKLAAKLKADFRNGPVWKAAVEAVRRTGKEHNAAHMAAVARARAKPEYAKAASEHRKVRQEYDALTATPADAATTEQLVDRVRTARCAMDKLETTELKADPEVARTKQAFVKAQADLAALRQKAEKAHENDPAYKAHQDQIKAAKKAVVSAWREQREQENEDQARAEREQQARLQQELIVRLEMERIRQEVLIGLEQQRLALEYRNSMLGPWQVIRPIGPCYDTCVPHQGGVRYRYYSANPGAPSYLVSPSAGAATVYPHPTLPPAGWRP